MYTPPLMCLFSLVSTHNERRVLDWSMLNIFSFLHSSTTTLPFSCYTSFFRNHKSWCLNREILHSDNFYAPPPPDSPANTLPLSWTCYLEDIPWHLIISLLYIVLLCSIASTPVQPLYCSLPLSLCLSIHIFLTNLSTLPFFRASHYPLSSYLPLTHKFYPPMYNAR